MTTKPHTDSSTEEFRSLLAGFFASRSIRLTPEVLAIWGDALGDLSIAEVKHAIKRFTRESTDYPTPAAVRKFAIASKGMSDAERAAHAWSVVRKAVRTLGVYRTVDFDDRLVNAVIRQLDGWIKLCNKTTAELVWYEKEFVAVYQTIAKSGIGDASPLPGLADRENQAAGFRLSEAAKIESDLTPHIVSRRLEVHTVKQRAIAAPVSGCVPNFPSFEVPSETDTDSKAERIQVERERLRSLAKGRGDDTRDLQRLSRSRPDSE